LVLTSTAVLQVDPRTGKRTLLSGCQDSKCVGTGPSLTQAQSLALKGDGTIVVADISQETVLQIDPQNGDRLAILQPNTPPLPQDDQGNTSEGKAITITILPNDTDDQGANLLRIVAATQGTHGTVSIKDSLSLLYTPDPTFHGMDTFSYTVIDPLGAKATA